MSIAPPEKVRLGSLSRKLFFVAGNVGIFTFKLHLVGAASSDRDPNRSVFGTGWSPFYGVAHGLRIEHLHVCFLKCSKTYLQHCRTCFTAESFTLARARASRSTGEFVSR